MNEVQKNNVISGYLAEVREQFESGHAIEHAYRPALKSLMSSFEDVVAVNDPKHSEHGAPDFIFLKKSNNSIIRGRAEAKDIGVSLDKVEKTDQMHRYAGYPNLILTDYLEFRFFKNGEKYETISLGQVKNGTLVLTPENSSHLMDVLQDFLDLPPEKIRSGKRLAAIMGAKARLVRDNVEIYLTDDSIDARDFEKIFEMMKKMLVHDLDARKFADMYAQTLVYGLFVARYGDDTPATFSRSEARDLVPKTNPFLYNFFDHIAGAGFDKRLAKIVDELCDIFMVSDVREIVHKHLKIADTGAQDAKDPIIHFYEDFLQSYDPAERKRMGAYYTPIPVVQFIVRHVDKILKEEFGIAKGLASTETVTRTVATQPWRLPGERKDRLTREVPEPRVQILDPAVGTATFLNETIKYIYDQNFKGAQEGKWPSYANENLIPRLFGFELMMAPYTVAHLKLGMTLRETGVDKLTNRLNVFLTNTLEEGVPQQPDLFSFGLAEAVSEESRLAAEVKSEKPVMVVMGNPPYSVSSNNKSKYIEALVAAYKKDLNERNIQPLSDDYIKFIRFAEDMITRNGSGIVAMITNNSYVDGLIHRQMRKHLLETFDKIYILDLHGNSKKKETAPDGSKDENVFDIMQGVSIILAVKTGEITTDLATVYHAELYGKRSSKFDALNDDALMFEKVNITAPSYYFIPINGEGREEYVVGVSVNDLFVQKGSGIKFRKDKLLIRENYTKADAVGVVNDMQNLDVSHILSKYGIKETSDWQIDKQRENFKNPSDDDFIKVQYRPFDNRWTYYPLDRINNIIPRGDSRRGLMKNIVRHENLLLSTCRQQSTFDFQHVLVSAAPIDMCTVSIQTKETSYAFPLYIYHDDGTRDANFAQAEHKKLTAKLAGEPKPEEVFDYIYAILHSPQYREKFKDFLKSDFPRVPVPTQADFDRLVPLGRELRELHLMKSPIIDDFVTTYPVAGGNVVEKIAWIPDQAGNDEELSRHPAPSPRHPEPSPRHPEQSEGSSPEILHSVQNDAGDPMQNDATTTGATGKVYINDTQYFGNVPELAWNFYIGGYQPAQKWLKDRKGRALSSDDLDHYQRIIKILLETNRIMSMIG